MSCPIKIAINEIKTGGLCDSTCPHDHICDNAIYYLMQRKIQKARAEASGNTSIIPAFAGHTFASQYAEIMSKCSPIQFDNTISMITMMEELILKKLYTRSANVSLPSLVLVIPSEFSPPQIHKTVNDIGNYINKICIGIRSLLKNDPGRVETFAEFSAEIPDMSTVLTMENEEQIILYCVEVEKYQCAAMRHLEKISEICKNIVV